MLWRISQVSRLASPEVSSFENGTNGYVCEKTPSLSTWPLWGKLPSLPAKPSTWPRKGLHEAVSTRTLKGQEEPTVCGGQSRPNVLSNTFSAVVSGVGTR